MKEDTEQLLVSTRPEFRQYSQHGQYYIAKDYSTNDKKRLLDRIAVRLGIHLKVEIVPKL